MNTSILKNGLYFIQIVMGEEILMKHKVNIQK